MNDESKNQFERIELSHGQVKWLLFRLFRDSTQSTSALDSYLKHLRRNGIPFTPNELGTGTGTNLIYRYANLMELVLAFYLKGKGMLKTEVVSQLVEGRETLRDVFLLAYLDSDRMDGGIIHVKYGSYEDQDYPGWKSCQRCFY